MTDDSLIGWRERILESNHPTQEERHLLSKGPSSLAQAWRLQAIKYKYKYLIPGTDEDTKR